MFGNTSYRLRHAVRLAIRSLAAHRLRSALTTLGIVLGVASVIVMLAVGEAARYNALKQLEDLGANTILLRSTKPTDEPSAKQGTDLLAYGLTYADLERIRSSIPTVQAATPMREFRKTARYFDRKLECRIVSITPEFFVQNNIRITHGRAIEPNDETKFDNVAILGSSVAESLFPTKDPLGRTVNIDDFMDQKSFKIIGVIEPKTLAIGSDGGEKVDFNKVIFIPFATDKVRFGRELFTIKTGSFQVERLEISQIVVTVDSTTNVMPTAKAIESLIDQFHPRKDVNVLIPLDLLQKAEQTQRLFTLILGAIAGVSLIVGGIGIMNIMLATVTERTREIGVRRALGAKQRDIATQFLIETVVLSCGGGLLGIGLGIGITYLLTYAFDVPTIIRLWSPTLAFGVSVLVGLLSGSYPARRAARLDPIEALRHE